MKTLIKAAVAFTKRKGVGSNPKTCVVSAVSYLIGGLLLILFHGKTGHPTVLLVGGFAFLICAFWMLERAGFLARLEKDETGEEAGAEQAP